MSLGFVPQEYDPAVPVASLEPHPRNVNEGDVGAISETMDALGFFGACLVQRSSRRIIAGKHRWLTVQALGGESVPVLWVDVDDDTAVRIMLADNRTARLGRDDDSALAALLTDLVQGTEPGLAGTGFDDDALNTLLADLHAQEIAGRTPEDTQPGEPPAEPVTRPGDVWVLGDHRLLCGDARDDGDYHALLDEDEVACVVTDPPYGVAIGDKNAALNSVGRGNPHEGPLAGDQGIDDAEELWRQAFAAVRAVLQPGTGYYIFGPQGGGLGELLLLLLRESGLEARHILIWVKDRPTFSLGRLDYEYQHEPICYGWVPGAAHAWHANEAQSSVIKCDRPAASKLHPTMKPVAVIEPLIRNSTTPGQVVLDPFGGSGTVLIVCENLDRHARLIEIDPGYCDVICERWQRHTGRLPERDGVPNDFLGGAPLPGR